MNKILLNKAKEIGLRKYIPMDILYSKYQHFSSDNDAENSSNDNGIEIQKYNATNNPIKNAMRPIHKILDPNKICQ
jgi:hypothetical protein